MPLPTHQDGVENRDKVYCRFASAIAQFRYIKILTWFRGLGE